MLLADRWWHFAKKINIYLHITRNCTTSKSGRLELTQVNVERKERLWTTPPGEWRTSQPYKAYAVQTRFASTTRQMLSITLHTPPHMCPCLYTCVKPSLVAKPFTKRLQVQVKHDFSCSKLDHPLFPTNATIYCSTLLQSSKVIG